MPENVENSNQSKRLSGQMKTSQNSTFFLYDMAYSVSGSNQKIYGFLPKKHQREIEKERSGYNSFIAIKMLSLRHFNLITLEFCHYLYPCSVFQKYQNWRILNDYSCISEGYSSKPFFETMRSKLHYEHAYYHIIINSYMGNTACCSGGEQEIHLQLGPDDNVHEKRFFYFHPDAEKTISSLNLPTNYRAISRTLETVFAEEGVFLGKKCSVRHGLGIMIYEAEGLYYIGNFINGSRQGLGYMINSDGSYYQGEWYQNLPHGYGEYYSPDRTWIYKGKWKAGQKEGVGEEIFPDGTIFKGCYKDGLKEGEGLLVFTTECQFDDRNIEQKGSAIKGSATGATKMRCNFRGFFKADVACGPGIQKGENYKYDGNWQNNQMHGAGKSTYYDSNGNETECYIGQFKNGLKDGYGQYRWADGRIYKGQWAAGQLTSRGVFIDRRE